MKRRVKLCPVQRVQSLKNEGSITQGQEYYLIAPSVEKGVKIPIKDYSRGCFQSFRSNWSDSSDSIENRKRIESVDQQIKLHEIPTDQLSSENISFKSKRGFHVDMELTKIIKQGEHLVPPLKKSIGAKRNNFRNTFFQLRVGNCLTISNHVSQSNAKTPQLLGSIVNTPTATCRTTLKTELFGKRSRIDSLLMTETLTQDTTSQHSAYSTAREGVRNEKSFNALSSLVLPSPIALPKKISSHQNLSDKDIYSLYYND